MSIEVRIPKEITEYREKILFGLTIRQLLCFALAIILGTGSYFLLKKFIGKDIASYVVILEVIPIFAVGFFKKNGFTFEKYVKLILRHRFGKSHRRFQPELSLNHLNKEDVKNVRLNKKKGSRDTEQSFFEITKEDRKRKCKAVRRKIAEARKEYRRAKQKIKKRTSQRKSAPECAADNQI